MYACIGGHYSFSWNGFLWVSVMNKAGVEANARANSVKRQEFTSGDTENGTYLFEVSLLIVNGHG